MGLQLGIQEPQNRTLIAIDFNSTENLNYVLTLLRSLNFVKNVAVVSEEILERQSPKPSRFARFYGAAKTGLSPEELDKKLDNLRTEWERDI